MKKLKKKKVVKTCETCFGQNVPEDYCANCKNEHPVRSNWEPNVETCRTCVFKGRRASQARGFSEGVYFCARYPPKEEGAFSDVTTHYDNWCGEWQLDSEYAIR